MNVTATVAGYCPACGQAKLLLHKVSGEVRCSNEECSRRDAVFQLLQDHEIEHVVRVDGDGFTIRHPLRERIDGDLFGCGMLKELHFEGFVYRLDAGDYRVTKDGLTWAFEPLP